MKEQWKIFLTAVSFYTRIPCGSIDGFSDELINKSTRYFPLIGWIVGGISALVLYLSLFLLPAAVSVLLSICTSVLLTGAFHEDGFADTCDGFGGGWTKDRILDIMKDSRVGAYGVIGILLLLAVKASSLFSLVQFNIIFAISFLLMAHTLSRFAAVTVIYSSVYSREDASSKVKPVAKKLSPLDLLVSGMWVVPSLLLLKSVAVVYIVLVVLVVTYFLSRYFTKWIGGYTGDCLGAIQQLTEVVIYLSGLVLWKYI